MKKFKVGDIVTGIDGNPARYGITNEHMIGEVMAVSRSKSLSIKVLEQNEYPGTVGNTYDFLNPNFFRLVHDWRVVIYPEGNTTIAKLYKKGVVKKEVSTKKHPDDKYDINEAVKSVCQKLTEPSYYNGKVVCVASNLTTDLTVGKIYKLVDGNCISDSGAKLLRVPVKSIVELNNRFFGSIKFIELVE